MPVEFTTSYLADSIELFHYYKRLADRALAQVSDDALFATIDEESNSIAIVVKHVTGNMRSRWTDFLTTDGEKPTRHRDAEFVLPATTRAALLEDWEQGWAVVFRALALLTESDLARKVMIRGEAHSVMQAINRQIGHYAYHTGQIVYLAKHFAAGNWTALTIPRNRPAEADIRAATGNTSPR